MTIDYLARLKEKCADVRMGSTAKTDETPELGAFGSFGGRLQGRIHKNHMVVEPLPVTQGWLEAQGCYDVLEMDVAHIKKHLPVGTAARNRTLQGYVNTWLQAADAEPAPHRKDNVGRRAANIAIRERKL